MKTTELKIEKPIISAADFGTKRLNFIKERISQFAERENLTWEEVEEIRQNGNSTERIDKVVDTHLHSRFCPDPTQHVII